MNNILLDRRTYIERRIITGLASCDTLTMMQIAVHVYHDATAAAVAATQRKLREMICSGYLGRTRGGDGRYRYYLQTRGCYAAAPYLNFVPTPGHDRSYLNCSRQDAIINRLIRDANQIEQGGECAVMLGRGALRRIQDGKFSDLDAILGVRRDEKASMVKLYVKIDVPNAAGIAKYENGNKRALQFDTTLNVVANEFTRKKLGLKS